MLECKGHSARSQGPRIQPLLCDLEEIIFLLLVSEGEKVELNDRSNPAPTFYISKIQLGFSKASNLDIRTDLAKRELGFCPIPPAHPLSFNPSFLFISSY